MRLPLLLILLICFIQMPLSVKGQSAVRQKVVELARQEIDRQCKKCHISVDFKWMQGKMADADTTMLHQFQFDDPGLPRGYQTGRVFGKGKELKVQLYIDLELKVPVAAGRIDRSEEIRESSLIWKRKNLSRLNRLPLLNSEAITGKAARKMIPAGDFIYDSDVRQVPIVEPGDSVTMLYRSGGVNIAISCQAREAKAAGERIRIRSKETGQVYIAKVITSNKVIWEQTL